MCSVDPSQLHTLSLRLKYHGIMFLNKEKFVDTQCSLSQVSELRSKQSDSSSARLFYSAFLCVLLFGLLHFHSLSADAQLLSLVQRKVVKSLAGRAAVCSSFNLCGWCPRPPASATSSFYSYSLTEIPMTTSLVQYILVKIYKQTTTKSSEFQRDTCAKQYFCCQLN